MNFILTSKEEVMNNGCGRFDVHTFSYCMLSIRFKLLCPSNNSVTLEKLKKLKWKILPYLWTNWNCFKVKPIYKLKRIKISSFTSYWSFSSFALSKNRQNLRKGGGTVPEKRFLLKVQWIWETRLKCIQKLISTNIIFPVIRIAKKLKKTYGGICLYLRLKLHFLVLIAESWITSQDLSSVEES